MRARAEHAEQTAARVIDAAIELWRERPYDEFTLQDVADRAGVAVSTVTRRFSSKEGLAEAILTSDRVGTQRNRDAVAAGDVAGAVRMITQDYEVNGDAVIRMLALEHRFEMVDRVLTAGRAAHLSWVERVFSTELTGSPESRRRQILELVVATDVYTWKLLRRDMQLDQTNVQKVVADLCGRVIGGG